MNTKRLQNIKKKKRQQGKKQGTMDLENNQKTIKIAIVNPYLSIITLNIKGLNFQIRQYGCKYKNKIH